MKSLLTAFGNFVLVLAAVTCTIGVLVTAFHFHLDDMMLFLIWLVAALAMAINVAIWRGKGLLVLLAPILALILWRLPEIIEGAKWVLYVITSEYSKWLFVPVLFSESEAYAYDLTLFFAALGIVLAFLLSFAISLQRSTFLTILFTAPIVCSTFVLVFIQPEPWFLLGLLAVYLTLLISSGLQPDDFVKRGLLIFPALALSFVLMGAAYLVTPPGNFTRGENMDTLDEQFRTIASRLGIFNVKTGVGWPVIHDNRWGFDTNNVGISGAGTRIITDVSVMQVTATHAGTFYLRGYSMQHFDGREWTVNSEALPDLHEDPLARGIPALISRYYSWRFPNTPPREVHMTIDITGDVSRNIVYTPYFAFPFRWYTRPYEFHFFHLDESVLVLYSRLPVEDLTRFDLTEFNGLVNSRDTYLQINDSTAAELRRIAVNAGIDPYAHRAVISDQVAEFMVSFGRYTLSPFVIPENEDFSLYFLQTSRQGYCIHYATAATQMLRALGVPARFTSGFVVTVPQASVDLPVVVTDRNAHAWVEVYYDNTGWVPLEVTPPATGFGINDGRPHADGGEFFMPGGIFDDEEDMFPDWWPEDENGDLPALEVDTGTNQDETRSGAVVFLRGIITGILIVAVIMSPFLHRHLAKKYRRKRFALEDTNAAAIFTWRYIARLMRHRRWEGPPEEIEDIALKARFSLHRISEAERSAIVSFAASYAEKVYQYRTPIGRFWVKYIRGL